MAAQNTIHNTFAPFHEPADSSSGTFEIELQSRFSSLDFDFCLVIVNPDPGDYGGSCEQSC